MGWVFGHYALGVNSLRDEPNGIVNQDNGEEYRSYSAV